MEIQKKIFVTLGQARIVHRGHQKQDQKEVFDKLHFLKISISALARLKLEGKWKNVRKMEGKATDQKKIFLKDKSGVRLVFRVLREISQLNNQKRNSIKEWERQILEFRQKSPYICFSSVFGRILR